MKAKKLLNTKMQKNNCQLNKLNKFAGRGADEVKLCAETRQKLFTSPENMLVTLTNETIAKLCTKQVC